MKKYIYYVHTSKMLSKSSLVKQEYLFKSISFSWVYLDLADFQFVSSSIWKIAAPIDK